MKLFNKKEQVKKIETVTLTHYKLTFKTVDGELHEYNNVPYVDESSIIIPVLNHYLSGKAFLNDDNRVCYPIQNIISVSFSLDKTIKNVKKITIGNLYSQTWYRTGMIEIIKEES